MDFYLIVIGFTCLVSYFALNRTSVMDNMIFHPYRIHQDFGREYMRFVTAGFIHADFGHLFFNMLTLYFFGSSLELYLGKSEFLFIYFGGMIVSMIWPYYKHQFNENYRALGASGAVASVLFANLIIDPWQIIYIKFIIPVPFIVFAVFYLWYSYYMDKNKKDNIGHDVHFVGAIFGFLYMVIAHMDMFQDFIVKLSHPHFFN